MQEIQGAEAGGQIRSSYRDTWAEIDTSAIQHNIKSFKTFVKQGTKVMAVVKADGYGHGAYQSAEAALRAGADMIGVAILDEAIQLRNQGVEAPILILGYTPARGVREAILRQIAMTVYTMDIINEVNLQAQLLKMPVSIHIKIDTGMGRIGATTSEEAIQLVEALYANPYVLLQGVFTHFADADRFGSTYTMMQYERFLSIITDIERSGYQIPLKHCCNSAATINFPEMHLDTVRIGIAMYGIAPSVLMEYQLSLKPAIRLKTRIVSVKELPAKQAISYGCTHWSEPGDVIATLPIGYADGLSRALSNKGTASIRGRRVPIIGNICMDQSMIDVTSVELCRAGEEVVLIGNGPEEPTVYEVSKWMSTIPYEVVCLIGKRVPRVYV